MALGWWCGSNVQDVQVSILDLQIFTGLSTQEFFLPYKWFCLWVCKMVYYRICSETNIESVVLKDKLIK